MGNLLPTELEYFREAALRGSVNGAASALHVAGSAVSRHIRKLERSLGVQLFLRHGRGVELTEAGRRLLAHVRRTDIETAALLEDLAEEAGEDRVLTVACSSGFSTTVIARAAARLYGRHPELRLDVQTVGNEEATRLVIEERADVAVTFSTRPPERVRIEYSLYLPTHVVTEAGSELSRRSAMTVEEVLDHPYGLLRGHSSQRELLAAAARRQGRELRPVLESDQRETLVEFVRAGGGVAFASTLSSAEAKAKGVVLVELTDPELQQRSAQLQTSPWRQLNRAELAFLEVMGEELQEVGRAADQMMPE